MLRVIAFAFFVLAAYTIVGSTLSLTGVTTPESSNVGIVLAAVSVVVMPFLSVLERRTGRELGSATVVADSKADPHLLVALGGGLARPRRERRVRMDLGRCARRPRDRSLRHSRRHRSVER